MFKGTSITKSNGGGGKMEGQDAKEGGVHKKDGFQKNGGQTQVSKREKRENIERRE